MEHRRFTARFLARMQDASGVHVALLALCMSVIVALILLTIQTGYLSAGKSQFSKIADLAALAALEGYTESTESSYADRIGDGLDRAIQIASSNKVTGVSATIGAELALNDARTAGSSRVTFGVWYPKEPSTNPPASCAPGGEKKYPCFVPNATASATYANAVEVELCNEAEASAIVVPIGHSRHHICSSSVAALRENCVAFLLDVSTSTVMDTHYSVVLPDPGTIAFRVGNGGNQIPYIANPPYAALAFYPAEVLQPASRCMDAQYFDPDDPLFIPTLFWCTMPANRPLSAINNPNPKVHYRDDYGLVSLKDGGNVLVDQFYSSPSKYYGPQPLSAMMLSMNVALATMQARKTGADKAMLIAFNRNIVKKIPEADAEGNHGLTTDLGYLMQLTNMELRGLRGNRSAMPQHPNFLDVGFYPQVGAGTGDTNIVLAMDVAIEIMKNSCSAQSDKSIMLFTDGKSTCVRGYSDGQHPAFSVDSEYPSPEYDYSCANLGYAANDAVSYESRSWDQIIGIADSMGNPSILQKLQGAGIRLTTVLAGEASAPNFLNKVVPGSNPPRFMTQEEAYLLGFGHANTSYAPADVNTWFTLWHSSGPSADGIPGTQPIHLAESCAKVPRPGYYCGDINRLFSGVSLDTGGTWCPLMPPCAPLDPAWQTNKNVNILTLPPCPAGCTDGSCYDENNNLKAAARGDPAFMASAAWSTTGGCSGARDPVGGFPTAEQRCALRNITTGQQAAECAQQTVAGNPYMLVKPD
ncbi:MAG: hypothetical protein K1X83_10890 [Oligoflexia bacterium]|nr:hypothetical protein [Oligoflexia bacterium]